MRPLYRVSVAYGDESTGNAMHALVLTRKSSAKSAARHVARKFVKDMNSTSPYKLLVRSRCKRYSFEIVKTGTKPHQKSFQCLKRPCTNAEVDNHFKNTIDDLTITQSNKRKTVTEEQESPSSRCSIL